MKVSILYHPHSEHAHTVEQFAHDFERQRGEVIELISLETKEGAAMASMYDLVQYPALLVLSNDGQLRKSWEGAEMPLMDEVAAYCVV